MTNLRTSLRRTIQGNIERPHYTAGPGAYWELAAKVLALLDALDTLDDAAQQHQPRRLLCHYCVQLAVEGDVIHEAMTIANGTAVCHEHNVILPRIESGGPKC
jgi:hypothetical protein